MKALKNRKKMKVAGANEFGQLCADSNNKSASYYPVVSPPLESRLDISQGMSYSVYRDHSVWITREMKAHAIGDNSLGQICNELPLEKINQESEFEIHDTEGNVCELYSAVCGQWYTLYLVQPKGSTDSKLAYVAYKKNNGVPLFLDIGGRKPIGLFGGESKSAAIDSTGAIIIITESLFDSPAPVPQIIELPGNEQAISLACCNYFIAALSSTGHLYLSAIEDKDNNIFSAFLEVPTLSGIKIAHVSGSFEHCFAVSEEGKVFGIGSNNNGILGLGPKCKKAEKFREIVHLNNQKIIAAFAGLDESLFITEEGKILSCGNNYCGQLLYENKIGQESVFRPRETVINSGATFCIAGYGLSAVFVGCEPPPYSPNKAIAKEKLVSKEKQVSNLETQTQEQVKSLTTQTSQVIADVQKPENTSTETQVEPLVEMAETQVRALIAEPQNEPKNEPKNNPKLEIEQSTPGFDIELKATENVQPKPAEPPVVDEKKSKCCLLI